MNWEFFTRSIYVYLFICGNNFNERISLLIKMDGKYGNKPNNFHRNGSVVTEANLNDIDDMKFIKLVEKNDVLYDRKSPYFTNEQHKQEVWKDIANILKCPAADCMTKWMILRRRFIRERENEIEREREIEIKSGKSYLCEDAIKSTWKYMDVMRFMGSHVTLRIPSSTVISLPERSTAVSKSFRLELHNNEETFQNQEQKIKSKSLNRFDSKQSRKQLKNEISNQSQLQQESRQRQQSRQQQQSQQQQQEQIVHNYTPEKEIPEQQKENIVLHDCKKSEINNKNKNMLTSFLIAKQNRLKTLGERYKKTNGKSESVKQTQYCQKNQLFYDDKSLKNSSLKSQNNTQSIQTQSASVSNSSRTAMYDAPIRKHTPRYETTRLQKLSPDGYYSHSQQLTKSSATMTSQLSVQRVFNEQISSTHTSSTQTLPFVQEDEKNGGKLTSMVRQLIDIVQSVHKIQSELVHVRCSTAHNTRRGCNSCLHKHRNSSISHKLNDSRDSISTNFQHSSFNSECFTPEQLFGRLIASEISQLDSEVLINNAKLQILKIIYKLRLGENVTVHSE